MVFISITVVIFYVYNILIKKIAKDKYKPYFSLLPLLLLSVIVSIALGSNYISSLSANNDGIAINNMLAYWIIGEGGWTITEFRNYFLISVIISLSLPCVYIFQRKCLLK